MKNKKIGVYTCITGNYDNVNEIKKEKGIDYFLFTNNKKIKSDSWKVIYIEDNNLSNVKLARKIKILGHPVIDDYDILVWMDGAVSFDKKIKDFIDCYLDENISFVAFKHGERHSIREEAIACVQHKKESKDNIKKILEFYKDEGYKDDNGLIESTVYIKRPKDSKVKETMKLWFDMILNYSKRDQLSFNYCIYKTGLNVKWINKKVFDNEWFTWKIHNSNKNIDKYRVYFGDMENYNPDNDIQGYYEKDNDNYSFHVKVLEDVDSAIIEITDVSCIYFDNLKISGISDNDIELYNYTNYKGKKLFYNNNAVLKINKRLIKDEKLEFSINLKKLTDDEKDNFIEYLSIDKVEKEKLISDLECRVQKLEDELNNMLNSKSWKITEPLRKLMNR